MTTYDRNLIVRIDQDLEDHLTALSDVTGLGRSDLVRRLIRRGSLGVMRDGVPTSAAVPDFALEEVLRVAVEGVKRGQRSTVLVQAFGPEPTPLTEMRDPLAQVEDLVAASE